MTPKMGSTTAEQLRDDAVAADADGDAALARRLRLRASLGRDAPAPARSVSLRVLRGSHCRLHVTEPQAFLASLRGLVDEARLTDHAEPIRTAERVAAAAAAQGTPLGDMLEPAGLAHLAVIDGLAALGTDGCCELYERAGRTAFIGEAKRLGVSSLGDRQKLATIIGKAVKERR